MNTGLLVLGCVDVLLAAAALWVFMRHGPGTAGALRATESILLLAGALIIHTMAVLACGVITKLTEGTWTASEQLTLIVASLAGGALPVLLLGYLLTAGVAHSLTAALSGDRPASPIPATCAEADRLVAAGEIDGAVQAYKRFYRQYPQSTRPLLDAAVLLARHQRTHEAADLLRQVMRLNRDNPAQWTASAQLLANLLQNELGEPESAEFLLEEIRRRAPASKPVAPAAAPMSRPEMAAKMDRARTMAGRGMTDEALRLFREIDRADPASPHALKAAAVALEADGRTEEAYAMCRDLMRRFPEDIAVWAWAAHRVALACINSPHREEEARTVARLIVQKAPGTAQARWAGAYLMQVNREST